ncbi:MAG: leucyl aminopeptidase [Pseudomonadota bacterium]|nr:leucyl aminopeptidase [Pseudomonadota bacterium]
MEFNVKSGSPEKQRTACLVLPVFEDQVLSAAARSIDKATGRTISSLLKRGDISGKCGKTLMLPQVSGIPADRILLVACGKPAEFSQQKLLKVTEIVIRCLQQSNITEASLFLPEIVIDNSHIGSRIEQIIIQATHSSYQSDSLKTNHQENKSPLRKITLFVPERSDLAAGKQALQDGQAIAAGVQMARQLGDLPGNICTPTYLAEQAAEIATAFGMKIKVLNEKSMEKLSMGALLSVSRGSRQEARLIVLEHRGGSKMQAPIVLVGKGLTFDAGGISLKPSSAMDEMKYDMCGGASVIGTMRAIAEMNLPLNVVAIVPSSENLPDGDANKPGDIVTSMSGQTIEILNTDAEGRLILCDALTYAERFKPSTVIDIATLTGACVVALGAHASGVFSHDEGLSEELVDAGNASQDRVWPMPLWDEYDHQLKSNFADMANIGGSKAGAVTAACFLARYTENFNWAHLDIAGTAWLSGSKKGATGRPVKLLCEFLRMRAAAE